MLVSLNHIIKYIRLVLKDLKHFPAFDILLACNPLHEPRNTLCVIHRIVPRLTDIFIKILYFQLVFLYHVMNMQLFGMHILDYPYGAMNSASGPIPWLLQLRHYTDPRSDALTQRKSPDSLERSCILM